MLFTTTNSRMKRYTIGTKKFTNSKKYLKEANKSARALYKDVRNDITGGNWDTVSAYAKSMRTEAKVQKRGFYKTAFNQAIKDSRTVQVFKQYGDSLKKAFRTGKLYKRENEMFDDMLNRSAGFETSESLNNVRSNDEATYDSARATISNMNAGSKAQLDMGRIHTGEMKTSFTRLNSVIIASSNAQADKLGQIFDFQNNVLRNQLDEGLKIDRERNGLLTEIRDLNKKMIINNDNYNSMSIEKDKTFLDLVMEGKFKDAMGKSIEEMIRNNQTAQNLNNGRRGLMSMMSLMASNPLMFLKSMITDSDQFKSLMGGANDPRQLLGRGVNRMIGSKNGLMSYLGKSMVGGENESLSSVDIRTKVRKGDMHWNADAQQSLIEVIPTYLRKILSSLEGGAPELIYNFETNKFRTKKDLEREIQSNLNSSVANGRAAVVGAKMVDWFKAKNNNANNAPEFTLMFDAFINDIARGGAGAVLDIRSILEWSWETYTKRFPTSAFIKTTDDLQPGENLNTVNKVLRENWDIMRVSARTLIDSDPAFAAEIMSIEKAINSWRREQIQFMKEVQQNVTESGYAVFANGADRYKINGAKLGGNGGGPPPTWQEQAQDTRIFKRNNSNLSGASARDVVAGIYNSDANTDFLFNRMSSMSYEDFKYNGIALNAAKFKSWVTKKYSGLNDEEKEAITKLFEKGKWDDIRAKLGVGEFDAYLMKIREENIFDVSKSTEAEKRKAKIFDDKRRNFKRFNSAYEGIHSAFGSISSDDEKRATMAGIIGKVATAAGLTGVLAAKGLIPFVATGGIHGGVLAWAAGAAAIAMLKNKDKIKELFSSGMTEDQRKDTKFVAKNIFSKVATGIGMASIAGIGGAMVGAPIWLVPILAGATGIAASMNSEKGPFKKFFFGQESDQNKTFFELFKDKMLGNPDDNSDDGIFGRFLNPIFEKTKDIFSGMNSTLKDKILDPLTKSMKTLVDKIDGSAIGQRFADVLGFSLSEFTTVMKKNVWQPLTGKLFGGLKKLLGFGRAKRNQVQEEMLNPYTQTDDVVAKANAEMAAGSGASTPREQRARMSAKRDIRKNGISRYAGGAAMTDMGEIRTSLTTPTGVEDLKALIGAQTSDPSKHYYSQKDPAYKDISMGLAMKIEDEGCGIMAAAMVLSRMGRIKNEDGGKTLTPKFVTDVLVPLSRWKAAPFHGVIFTYFDAVAKRFALESETRDGEVGFSLKELDKLTNNGKGAVVALVKQQTMGNHYIVITGVNGDRVFYDDPVRRRNMNITYDKLMGGAIKFIGFSKVRGIFGLLGRMFKGVVNFLSGKNVRNRKAKDWGVSREIVERMTREEWNKNKRSRSLDPELLEELKTRGSKYKDSKGGEFDTWKALGDKAYELVGNASDVTNGNDNAGAGARKAKKGIIPTNTQDTIPAKGQYVKGDRVPGYLSRKLAFRTDEEYKSLMFSATVHNTHVLGTMLAAVHTKLSELEVSVFNGTNGVAYNVEHIKRMNAIKNFGGVSEANAAVGNIDQKQLANPKFARRGGLKARIKQGITNLKDLITSRTIDPVVSQYYIMKLTFQEWMQKAKDFFNPGKLFDKVLDKFKGFTDNVLGTIGKMAEGLGKGFKMVGTVIGGAFKGIGTVLGGIAKGFGEAVSGVAQGVADIVSTLTNGIVDAIRDIPTLVTDTVAGLGKIITTSVSGLIGIVGKGAGLGYGAVSRVIKDIWGAGGALLRAGGTGIVAVRDFFNGKISSARNEKINYVRVLGGHLDTVGTVGSIDRDAYVKEWKNGYRFNKVNVRGAGGTMSGKSSLSNNQMYNQIDKEQDTAAAVQDKQNEILERIADKEFSGGPGGGSDKKSDLKIGWGAIGTGLAYLLSKLFNTDERTKAGHKMGPDIQNLWQAMTSKDTPFDIRHLLSLGKGVKNGTFLKPGKGLLGAVAKPFQTMGRGLVRGKNTIAESYKVGKGAFKNSLNWWKDTNLAGKMGVATEDIAKMRGGSLNKIGDAFYNMDANGVINKTVMEVGEDGVKSPIVTKFIDGVTAKSAGKAAQVAAKAGTEAVVGKGLLGKIGTKLANSKKAIVDDFAKWSIKAAEYIGKAMTSMIKSKLVKSLFGEEVVVALEKNIGRFTSNLLKNPAIKAGFGKVIGGIAKWIPVLNVALFIGDLYEGYKDADRYFSIPASKLTKKMKVVASLTRALQGLVAMNPWLIPIALMPTEWFVSAVWALYGSDEEKKELDKTKKEYADRYDAYHADMTSKGQKAKAYDDWIEEVGGDDSEDQSLWKKTGSLFVKDFKDSNKKIAKSMKDINAKDKNAKDKNSYVSVGGTYTTSSGKTVSPTSNPGDKYGAEGSALFKKATPTTPGGYTPGAGWSGGDGGTGAGTPYAPGQPGSGGAAKDGTPGGTAADYSAFKQIGKIALPTTSNVITSRALLWRKSTKSVHKGVDFRAQTPEPVYSVAFGKVIAVSTQEGTGYGKYIRIKHGDYYSLYAHLSKTMVKVGEYVQPGQQIAVSGQTGTTQPHLHFEIRKEENKGKQNTVLNPAKILGGVTFDPGAADGDVFGPGKGYGKGSSTALSGIDSLKTKMYSQNSSFNMSAGGDGMTLKDVGCGPVTTNLFLQDSGVREPLAKTASTLRSKRKANDGFSPEALSSYITSRGVGNRVTNPDKSIISKVSYGIAFVSRNCKINALDENHAVYMKHISAQGVMLYDPYFETTKFADWNTLLSCAFSVIIPTGKSEITSTVKGGHESAVNSAKFAKVSDDTAFLKDALAKAKAVNAMKEKVKKEKEKSSVTKEIHTVASPVVSSNNDNIMIEIAKGISSKMDILISLMSNLSQGGTSKEDVNTGLNNVLNKIMRSMKDPKSVTANVDPWLATRNHVSKGGL